MIQLFRGVRRLGLAAVFCVLLLPAAARAQVTVDPTVTSVAPLFHYDYSVTNNESEDLAIVSLFGIALDPGAIQNLTAPTGFLANFDTGLGIVDFLGDADVFATGATVSGFSFDSPYGPQTMDFSALSVLGTSYSGSTQGPAGNVSVVPEPGSLFLLVALGVSSALFPRRRARK